MSIREFNEKYIESFATSRLTPRTRDVFKEFIGNGHNALDVGCGSGEYTAFCQSEGNHIVGVELTSLAKRAIARQLRVCQGNAEAGLPFPDGSFDLVICIEVIEHVLEPDAVLQEIHRVLRPGGILVLTTPNYAHWVLRILALVGVPPMGLEPRHFTGLFRRAPSGNILPWRDPHIRFFSPTTITSLLNHTGFRVSIIRCSFVGFPSALAPYLPWPLALPLRAIGKAIGNLNFLGDYWPSLLAAGLLIKATKK